LNQGKNIFWRIRERRRAACSSTFGCGTVNFLAAASDGRISRTGIELDRNAASFARERLGLVRYFR